jgi:ABC-type sugar transport system ATPase subunit
MDEPTAALSQVEADRLLDLVSRLRETGTGIIYISHQLGEIQRLSDRVTVLRDGSNIGTFDPRDRTLDQLGALMLGNVVESVGDLKARSAEPGPVVLEVRNLQAKGVAKIDFEVRQGEIIAITGLLGSGYLEVGLTLFGAQPTHGGQILLEGEPLVIRNPAHACALGFAFVPPDRKKQGVLTDLSIAENVTLPTVAAERRPWVTRRWTGDFATKALRPLRVRAESINSSPATLSGGNQQKLVFAKWTGRSARLLILAEPTSGIDVGAKEEIFKIIDSLACAGSAVVLVSSDFGEVARIATRVLVMRRGRFDREVGHSELSADRLFALASR